jgi:hypothetical protein
VVLAGFKPDLTLLHVCFRLFHVASLSTTWLFGLRLVASRCSTNTSVNTSENTVGSYARVGRFLGFERFVFRGRPPTLGLKASTSFRDRNIFPPTLKTFNRPRLTRLRIASWPTPLIRAASA